MKWMRLLQRSAVALACIGMLTAQLAQAAGGATRTMQAAVHDVALSTGGVLRGQINDVQGAPQARVQVAVFKDRNPVAAVLTDRGGQFEVRGLSAGIYRIQTAAHVGIYRVWAPGTAPPSARAGLLLVSDQQVVRGGAAAGLMANPLILGLLVAAAVGIPLALDSSSSS